MSAFIEYTMVGYYINMMKTTFLLQL